MEILIIRIEREHWTVICNNLPQRGSLAILGRPIRCMIVSISNVRILTCNLYLTILIEGHQINISMLVTIGKVFHLPFSTLVSQNIGIILLGFFKTLRSRLVEDVSLFVLKAGCQRNRKGNECQGSVYLKLFHIV